MTSVLVVDDDAFTRTTLTGLLHSLGYSDVLTAATVTDAMSIAHEQRPVLAVLDLDLGEGPTGIDLAHGLRRLDAGVSIVMLTSYASPSHAGQQRALPAGVGYLVKSELDGPHTLSTAIDAALAGVGARAARPDDLNAAQWETLRLVAAGYTNAEIARRRQMSEDAVNKAITRLVRTLGVRASGDENVRVMLARVYFDRTGTVSARRD